jgi:hypothetical protein
MPPQFSVVLKRQARGQVFGLIKQRLLLATLLAGTQVRTWPKGKGDGSISATVGKHELVYDLSEND